MTKSIACAAVIFSVVGICGNASAQFGIGPAVSWGLDAHGTGTNQAPSDLTDCVAVASGVYQTTALRADGSIRAWGWNAMATPSDVGPCVAVACGEYHVVALRSDHSVRAWGNLNNVGQQNVPSALRVAGSVVAIGANGWMSAAIRADGGFVAWGENANGSQTVPAAASPSIGVGVGYQHYLSLRTDGSVQGWGSGHSATSDGSWNQGQSLIPSDLPPCRSVAAGGFHSVAILRNGTLRAWGSNMYGQCDIPQLNGSIVQVATGGYNTIALRQDGRVFAWGLFYANNPTEPVSVPQTLGPCCFVAAGHPSMTAIQAPWSSDCNNDGVMDFFQVRDGSLDDDNHNNIPDVCEVSFSGVVPISGPSQGGSNITIKGTNFPENPTVLVGGTPATNVVRVSATRLTAITPTGLPGMTSISVNGFTLPDAFYYRPECGSDLDQSGSVDGGDLAILLLDYGPCYQAPDAVPTTGPLPPALPDASIPASDAPQTR
jgi:hypothetical protein